MATVRDKAVYVFRIQRKASATDPDNVLSVYNVMKNNSRGIKLAVE